MATTIAKVREIIDTEQLDAVITSLIGAANTYLNSAYSGITIASTLKDEIHRWMTAHMLACSTDRQGGKEKVGDAQIDYTGTYSKGLEMTSYGQMVLQLDTTGALSESSKKQVSILAISESES